MLSLAVVAYQVVIGVIIIAAAVLGGKIAFFIAVALCVVWTIFNVYLSPLLIIQFGTIAFASLIAFSNIHSDQHSELTTDINNTTHQDKINQSSQYLKQNYSEQVSSGNYSSKSRFLKVGQKYSPEQLDEYFRFNYKPPAGIKSTNNGEIVLFINSRHSQYKNLESGNVILFQGQNTGKGNQKIIYGNKKLYDAYGNTKVQIYLFKNYIYMGEYIISKKPFLKNGRWFFPIAPKKIL